MIKTVIFKLHNPSKKKRAILQRAFRNYHLLCDSLLKSVQDDLDGFFAAIGKPDRKGKPVIRDRVGKEFFPKQRRNFWHSYNLPSALKYGGAVDSTRALKSYKELLATRPNTSPPRFPTLNEDDREEARGKALEGLRICTDVKEAKGLQDEVSRQRKELRYRPLYFTNCDTVHGSMTLLRNPTSGNYYAVLHVAPSNREEHLRITEAHNLVDVRTGNPFLLPRGSSTAVLFPLEMGDRQVQRFFGSGGDPKEGKLAYESEKDEYYLHVAFEFTPEKVEPHTMMGIDRGIAVLCAVTILNEGKQVVKRWLYEGDTLRKLLKAEEARQAEVQKTGKVYRFRLRKHWAERIIHEATNAVADMALRYKSQVYVEDLTPMTNTSLPRKRSPYNRMLNRSQFAKFLFSLDYKLQERGLPKTKSVHPAYTSQGCVRCGLIAKENRPKVDATGQHIQHLFRCVACGHEDNADQNASHVIALKGPWHWMMKTDKMKVGGSKFEDHLKWVCSLTTDNGAPLAIPEV